MDSEKDTEEFQGREVFVSQLLDWDSLIHHLIIPADKAEAFKAHLNSPPMIGTTYVLTILFEGKEYKAFARTEGFTYSSYSKHSEPVFSYQSQKMKSGHVLVSQIVANAIQLIYSPQLVQALKDIFGDLFQRLSKNKERKDVKGYGKPHIKLVAGDSPNVFALNYCRDEKIQKKPISLKTSAVNLWLKMRRKGYFSSIARMDVTSGQSSQQSALSEANTPTIQILSDETANAVETLVQPKNISNIQLQKHISVNPVLFSSFQKLFANGIDLSPTSLQLLKANLPPELQDIVGEKNLRKWTFARNDGIRLLPEMVASKETIQSMQSALTNALEKHLAYALTALQDTYGEQLQHLSGSLEDLALFLKACILPSGMSIIGKEQEMMCIASGQSAEATYDSLAKIVRDILQEAGDAVSLNDLLEQLPYLNLEIINSLCKEQIGDAICFQMDEQTYWKLLEFYWLPEDFSNLLADIVSRIEEDYLSISLLQIKQELHQHYGESFEDDYAISDEATLKQIIQAAWNGPEHIWKNGNTWVKKIDRNNESTQKKSISALNAFLEHHYGIFHEDDFLKFARDERGLKTPNDLIVLAYLIPSCVRINERQWISPSDFENTCTLDSKTWEAIEQQLQYYLGNKSFLPIKDVPQAFYDSLEALDINGTKCYWNIYLLSSLCSRKLTKLRIVNTFVAPYATTGLLVPVKAQINEDDKFGVIDYVINSFPRQLGINYTAEDFYAFLNTNSIRLRKSSMLLNHLQELLEGGDNV